MAQDPRDTRRWKTIQKAMVREQPWCSTCQADRDLTVDHITPLCHGGDPWDRGNLRVLCRTCNSRKGARERRFLSARRTPHVVPDFSLPVPGENLVSRVW